MGTALGLQPLGRGGQCLLPTHLTAIDPRAQQSPMVAQGFMQRRALDA